MADKLNILSANPKAGYLAHQAEIDAAISRVLKNGRYILGEEVAAFEKEFAAYLGVGYSIGCGCGTEALELALRTCKIDSGDEVITVSHTAVATVAAIELCGAKPVLVDINPSTFNMDPNRLADTIKKRNGRRRSSVKGGIKAIIPVHLYGHPADMPAIMDIARRYRLYVIEDCAQSHGAAIKGRKTGGWGDISAFSFYPTKNLGALGDGGAVVTNHPKLAEQARRLREYGWRKRYISDCPGMNTRLDELQAAILRVKLRHLDEENARRREIAGIYEVRLSDRPLILPRVEANMDHVYHQYVIRCKHGRDELRDFLKTNSIATLIHYPMPVHLQPAYRGRVIIGCGGLQYTERVCREILSLPLYPQMSDEQIQRISKLIIRWCKQLAGKD